MYRLIRSVAIGSGAALAVGGSLYFLEQQQLSQHEQSVHLCKEWGFETRNNVLRAGSLTHNPAQQVKCYEQAINTIVNSRTDLRSKSESWLTSYGDLLRSLAIARAESREYSKEDILEPLKAAATIPFGSEELKAAGAAIGYQLSKDPKFLDINVTPPTELATEYQLKKWAPFIFEMAKQDIAQAHYHEALTKLIKLHKSVVSSSDPLCFQPGAGGYIAQILWKINKREEARKWLDRSKQQASTCRTPACRETTALLNDLILRAG